LAAAARARRSFAAWGDPRASIAFKVDGEWMGSTIRTAGSRVRVSVVVESTLRRARSIRIFNRAGDRVGSELAMTCADMRCELEGRVELPATLPATYYLFAVAKFDDDAVAAPRGAVSAPVWIRRP
jgi:hypothetical protein